ncbi:chloramphenicol 3-O phosphotransferase [Georgenia soli]|uniref:Chloramphenicol 3-O phosphotransferase n=1 Tax=Georgenia soli TaxID=638953 RepID=A0A2A9EQ92_9MICO|nr:AAA family ATPase [Georgenia soli]PFG40953.1 chloramphenicol 3-O phosphotransferase [Georgenia soli]
MGAGEVIVLSGTSASGKTTLAEELQRRAPAPLQYLPLDSFIDMLPCLDEPVFEAMVVGYHHAVAATARAGNNVVTDHFRPDLDLHLYRGLRVLLVGVHCSLDELLRREAGRPEHRRGFAAAQFGHLHVGRAYDIELDTTELSPEQSADAVLGCRRRDASDRMLTAQGAAR